MNSENQSKKPKNWNLIFSGIIAISTLLYLIVNTIMYLELKESNDLTRKAQELSSRAYVYIDAIPIQYRYIGKVNEDWTTSIQIVNKGSLPANLSFYAWVNEIDSLLYEQKPSNLTSIVLSPLGGKLSHSVYYTKAEMIEKLKRFGKAYLHCIIWYKDISDIERTSKYTFALNYREGITLPQWDIFYVKTN
ncbi:hypothetical protein C0389_03110 [bacterium]|nr:hypothetical protein [bacterium]